ncbi:MAG: SRPBCC family protein [Cyclobacteriaceae bacterium]
MKYSIDILIDVPREKAAELIGNASNMKFWQKGFVSLDHISGEAGQPGAKSKLKYQMGKREVEMVETITHKNLPEEFHANYETNGVFNSQKNYFKEENGQTRWISEAEFQCSGFMRILAFFMGASTFKKQSTAYMEDFKAFAEGNPKYGN